MSMKLYKSDHVVVSMLWFSDRFSLALTPSFADGSDAVQERRNFNPRTFILGAEVYRGASAEQRQTLSIQARSIVHAALAPLVQTAAAVKNGDQIHDKELTPQIYACRLSVLKLSICLEQPKT
jgi:hypothetical protein